MMTDPTQTPAIDEAERERLERLLAIDTVHISAIHLRALKLCLKGLYMGAPTGGDLEKDLGAAFQALSNVLEWVELRATLLPKEPVLPANPANTPPASADGQVTLH